MKIKTMSCSTCGSDNTAFSDCDEGGWMNKDLISCNGEGPFGIKDGKEVPLQKIKRYIEHSKGDFCSPFICECYGECNDECSVNVVMEDGTVLTDMIAEDVLNYLINN